MRDSDRARFGSLVERVRGGTSFGRALEDAYGVDIRKLEYEWREGLSQRFGLVPALTGGGLLWVIITFLAAAAWVKRRRQAKKKLAQWAREEAEMDAAIARQQQAASSNPPPTAPGDVSVRSLRASGPGADPDDAARAPLRVPVVEHEGRWYTLH
jgi:hypothetical protein